jgi:hypothetical protein
LAEQAAVEGEVLGVVVQVLVLADYYSPTASDRFADLVLVLAALVLVADDFAVEQERRQCFVLEEEPCDRRLIFSFSSSSYDPCE